MADLITSITLPSRGLLNPSNPVYGKSIDIKAIGFEQEKKIFGSNGDNILDKVLKDVILTEGVNLNELTDMDRMYILIKLRIHSYGDKYTVTGRCPECGKEEEYEISLDNLPEVTLKPDFKEPIDGVLPRTGIPIGVRLLRIKDKKAVEAEAKARFEKLKVPISESIYALNLERSLATINGESPKVGERKKLLESLTGMDLAYIDALRKSVDFGYKTEVNVVCKACEAEFKAPFRMSSEFFRPRFDFGSDSKGGLRGSGGVPEVQGD